METTNVIETGCCPRFNPNLWDEKNKNFSDKLFIRDHVISFFHIPLNFGNVMKRNIKKIEAAGAMPEEQIVLSDEKSLLGAYVYIAVSKKVPSANMAKVTGDFFVKVFEGPYQNMRKYLAEMKDLLKAKTEKIDRFYFYYPYCPKCAKTHGKNYIVILAEV